MFFEPRPPFTRRSAELGPNCEHWRPSSNAVGELFPPSYGPPTTAIFWHADAGRVERESAAFCRRDDITILAISPAVALWEDGQTSWYLTILYQERLPVAKVEKLNEAA